MEEDNENRGMKERDGSQIGFDSRMGRSKLVMFCVFQILQAQSMDDYRAWHKGLRNLYYMCGPFVSSTEAAKIKSLIETARDRSQFTSNRYIDPLIVFCSFDEATEASMVAFKDQFLMTQKQDDGEFNVEEALGE